MYPPCPNGGITAAEDRDLRHAATATLAPWRAAIAEARAAHRVAAATARPATARTKPNAPARPRRHRAPPSSALETLPARFAANRHAPDRTAAAPGCPPHASCRCSADQNPYTGARLAAKAHSPPPSPQAPRATAAPTLQPRALRPYPRAVERAISA